MQPANHLELPSINSTGLMSAYLLGIKQSLQAT